MGTRPFFKFYPSNWRADQALRICSAAARGLWIEMLCLMHEAKPYGHLVVSGRPVTEAQLATLSGFPLDQVSALLAELENAGVFSKNAKGVIYSRRMTRDESKAARCAKAGKQGGGNPQLSARKNSQKSATFKGTYKGEVKGESDVTFDLEARGHIPDTFPKRALPNLASPFSPKRKTKQDWTPEQRKAAWLSNICKELERTLPPAKYLLWIEAYMAGDKTAQELAEQIDQKLKERKARMEHA